MHDIESMKRQAEIALADFNEMSVALQRAGVRPQLGADTTGNDAVPILSVEFY